MSIDKFNLRNTMLALIIIGAAATRLLHLGEISQWSNFSPLGAMALFGGCYFSNKWKAVCMPLVAMLASDVIIYYSYYEKVVFFYEGAFWVYLSFGLMVLIGTRIKKVTIRNIGAASLVSVLIHWLISDVHPWWYGGIYPRTFEGYVQCLLMAIPFEKNLLFGNVVFGCLMFGGWEFVKQRGLNLRNTISITSRTSI